MDLGAYETQYISTDHPRSQKRYVLSLKDGKKRFLD